MYNAQVNAMIEAQEAYAQANAKYNEYIRLFDWLMDCEDEALADEYLDILAEISLNKQENLGLGALADAKREAEDTVLNLMGEFANKFADSKQQAEITEALELTKISIVARRKMIEAAKQMLYVA